MIKTYILAPNWSTAPPPGGPLALGHIIARPSEFSPLNRDALVVAAPNPTDSKDGFTMLRSRLVSRELGFFARAFGLVGVGVEGRHTADESDVLSCRALDTIAFDPSMEYVRASVNTHEMQLFFRSVRFKRPVFLVTGLKVARGASLKSCASRETAGMVDVGVSPPGAAVGAGMAGSLVSARGEGESWEASTDFIVAIRLKKIWYERGEVQSEQHYDQAVMQGRKSKAEELPLRADDNVGVEDVVEDQELGVLQDIEGEEKVNWIIPKIALNLVELS